MDRKLWLKNRLTIKIILGAVILWGVPIGIMSQLTFRHLRTIKSVSLQEARDALVSSRISYMKHHLVQQADKISAEFSKIKEEAHLLSSFAQPLIKNPTQFRFRNGSRYRFDKDGVYGNPTDDGHSRLFAPDYVPSMAPMIEATENLDILFKPLTKSEPRMVLAWLIHKDGFARTYPWRDFKFLPRDRAQTAWPFYFLADPRHDPSRKEVFTPLYTDPLSGDSMISCLSPVYVGGKHVATVGIDITVEKILQDISRVRLTENSSSMLISNNEVLAASSNLPLAALGLDPHHPPHGLDFEPSKLSEAGRLVLGKKPQGKVGVDIVEINKTRFFAGYTFLGPLGWRIVLLVPENDLTGPANQKAQAIFGETERIGSNFIHVLIFAMLAMATLGYVVLLHQSRGLRALLGGIREFAKGNLSHRLHEEESEFGRLAGALNSMAESLWEKKKELQRAYAQVEQGRKLTAVGRLAAGVAHEVNNPLATISTYTQLLLRSGLSAEASESLGRIMKEIDRIQEKMRNLLDLSRLQSVVRTKANPDLLVKDIADMACHEAKAHGIDLRLHLGENSREVDIDASGFKQVLWNLVGNAISAQSRDGGEVRISIEFVSEEKRTFLVLAVEDDGPGIPEDVLPHIFDPFFTTKEVGQGTGLGLAVVHTIVQGHGGRIDVHNLNPRGCRFRVLFPAEEDV
jgi:signal transduction histidine kinase